VDAADAEDEELDEGEGDSAGPLTLAIGLKDDEDGAAPEPAAAA